MRWVKVSGRQPEHETITLVWGSALISCDQPYSAIYSPRDGLWHLDGDDMPQGSAKALKQAVGEVTYWLEWETPAEQEERDEDELRGLHARSLSDKPKAAK